MVAVCEVDRTHAERACEKHGGKATIYDDYRRLLQRQDIDVIVNATPDHWHTAINIAACQAGRDVYTEKPLTLTIDEGKQLSQVVEATGRVVQVGRFLSDVDHDANTIITVGDQLKSYSDWPAQTRFHLENFKVALDTPGEWFLSRQGTLYYMPLPGQDINHL